MSPTDEVKELARSQGAQLVGMAGVEVYTDYLAQVGERLRETGAGPQDYMVSDGASFFALLSDARNALPGAKTIIMLGVYAYDKIAATRNTRGELRGKTARIYSYYPVVRQISRQIVTLLQSRGHRAIEGQHVPLKFLADRTGLGVYGKNGIFLAERYGSYIALRDVITDVELIPDVYERPASPCEDCDRCLRACPTGALYAPYKVNPKLCINPITRRMAFIEPETRSKMRNWVCGCDICQEVCPANRDLVAREIDPRVCFDSQHHSSHKHLDGLERSPDLIELLGENYPEILRRNAAIALANIGKGRQEALMALKLHVDTAPAQLQGYFRWAVNVLEDKKNQA